jgi:urea carboxylase
MWNRYRRTADFERPWLLRFYEVPAEELLRMREAFVHGRFKLEIEETTLRLADYRAFLAEHAAEIAQFKQHQQAAFDAERERWEQTGQAHYEADPAGDAPSGDAAIDIPEGCMAIASSVTGSVWQIEVSPGQRVQPDETLLVLEAMKMEIPIAADEACEIVEILVAQGDAVHAGQALVIVKAVDGEWVNREW